MLWGGNKFKGLGITFNVDLMKTSWLPSKKNGIQYVGQQNVEITRIIHRQYNVCHEKCINFPPLPSDHADTLVCFLDSTNYHEYW